MIHIDHLADPSFRGRAAGTDDSRKAADYIAAEFARYGLEPFGDQEAEGRSYHQRFSLTISRGIAAATELRLGDTVIDRTDYGALVTGDGSPMAVDAAVAFAGYGIHAPDAGYDDFAGLDLQGKWALVLRYEPRGDQGDAAFAGGKHTRNAHLKVKLERCAERGAAGVLLVTGPRDAGKRADRLPGGKGTPMSDAGIPYLMISRSLADRLLGGEGELTALQEGIDNDFRPRSADLPGPNLAGTVALDFDGDNGCSNVIGRIPGRRDDQVVVIGGHYDHVPPVGEAIYPGADDNASGTAGVLELAQHYATRGDPPARTIVLVAFGAEEVGLIGARYFVAAPPVPLERMRLMVNLDMLGRPDYGKVILGGLGTAPALRPLVEDAVADFDHPWQGVDSGGIPSDGLVFHRKGVPMFYVMTGLHRDLHGTGDTPDKIDRALIEKVVRLVAEIVDAVVEREEPLTEPASP